MKFMFGTKVYRHYFFSILLLLSIVFIVVGFFMSFILSRRDRVSQFEKIQFDFDNQISKIENRHQQSGDIKFMLSKNEYLDKIMAASAVNADENVFDLRSLVDDINNYSVINNDYNNVVIYLKENEIFVDSSNIGLYPKVYFDSRLYSSDLSYDEWKDSIEHKKNVIWFDKYVLRDGEIPFFVMYNNISGSAYDDFLLVTHFDMNPFSDVLADSAYFEESIYLVKNDFSGMLYQNVDAEIGDELFNKSESLEQFETLTYEGIKYTVFKSSFNYLTLECIWLIPNRVIYANTIRSLMELFGLYAFLLLLFISLAAYIVYENTRPLSQLLNKVVNVSAGKNSKWDSEFEQANKVFDNIIESNASLKAEKDRFDNTIKTIFFTKTLNGLVVSKQIRKSTENLMNNFFQHEFYTLLLLDFNDDSAIHSQELTSIFIITAVNEIIMGDFHVHQVSSDRMALILGTDEIRDKKTQLSEMQKIINALKQKTGYQIKGAVSETVSNYRKLSEPYFKCSSILDNEMLSDNNARDLIYQSGSDDLKRYSYTLQEEQYLIYNINNHRYEDAKKLISGVIDKNIEKNISKNEMEHLVDSLISTILRLVRLVNNKDEKLLSGIDDIVYKIRTRNKKEDAKQYFADIVELIAENNADDNISKSYLIYTQIYDMIEESFSETDFCLAEISNRLHYSTNYLSIIFKKYNGKGIPEVIEQKKQIKAGELALNTDILIKDINKMVGYSNINTFYKAFKRHYGLTPSQYRDINRGKKN